MRQALLDTLDSVECELGPGPRALGKATKLSDGLSETMLSVQALIAANSKLNHHLEKLNQDKLDYMRHHNEVQHQRDEVQHQYNEAAQRNLSLQHSVNTISEEKSRLSEQLQTKPPTSTISTLTTLHNTDHQCFILVPSDPARALLHMFVSQYR